MSAERSVVILPSVRRERAARDMVDGLMKTIEERPTHTPPETICDVHGSRMRARVSKSAPRMILCRDMS